MSILPFLKRIKPAGAARRTIRPAEIYMPLLRACKRHQFIYVQVKGDARELQSMILDVDLDADTLKIDELFPRNFAAIAGQSVTVIVKGEQGSSLRFTTSILVRENTGGNVSYTLQLPEKIQYHQRRQAFRLLIQSGSHGSRILVSPPEDSHRFLAQINDVSATGLGMRIEGDAEDVIPVGSVINSRLELTGLNMACRMSIRRVQVVGDDEQSTHLGGEFIDLNMGQQRVLNRYIMDSQRRSLLRD